ncbi:MAG: fatty acid hydroxylase family protein [Rhodospirillaceae bacterium]|nr:fatty acid hydroxylase family protein [Rhodospirillaceae bacterium]
MIVTGTFLKLGFWSDKAYYLDRMDLRGLTAAYFQYYAIAAYIVVAAACTVVVAIQLLTGAASLVPIAACIAATLLIYPIVWYLLHRYVLHSKWLWKSPLTAGTWKRIHYDHHSDPNNLKVLFGALYTTLPTVAVATLPVGYALAGWTGALTALATGVVETCVYEFFHCIQHLGYQPKWAWVREIKKFHMAHHFHNENGNYGITNLWWDKVLGTFYDGPKDRPRSPTVFNLGYDEDVAKSYPYVARLTPTWPYNTNPVQRKREAAAATPPNAG